MTNLPRVFAVVPAAGVGKRMAADRPKQYLELAGCTVIEHSLQRLLSAGCFQAIAVAISATDPYWPELAISQHEQIITAPGGQERADSVLSGLNALAGVADAQDWVMVHDAARPCLPVTDIRRLLDMLADDDIGGILGLPSHDTLKQVTDAAIQKTYDRGHIWRALTPQMFRFSLLQQALTDHQGNRAVTDEASAIELSGYTPKMVEGSPANIKITRPEDLALAEFYLAHLR
ncbi:MAG: 2-C-methyl-D-erythritol 4-phosphate cytidylyltransferase [Methylococcales bacterium]|nr:2-C-methyl-D-erythritol 4-phosphate cytidylyltransferase [Methylococcales bacterium]